MKGYKLAMSRGFAARVVHPTIPEGYPDPGTGLTVADLGQDVMVLALRDEAGAMLGAVLDYEAINRLADLMSDVVMGWNRHSASPSTGVETVQ